MGDGRWRCASWCIEHLVSDWAKVIGRVLMSGAGLCDWGGDGLERSIGSSRVPLGCLITEVRLIGYGVEVSWIGCFRRGSVRA